MRLAECLVSLSLGLAVFLVGLRTWTLVRKDRLDLTDEMGPAAWDFSQSWASTLTLAGALLASILAETSVVPETPEYLGRAAYGGLSILFGAISLLAPLLYTASKKIKLTGDTKKPRYVGIVENFLLASGLSIWAAYGQLFTVALLLLEVEAANSLPDSIIPLFAVLIVVAVVSLWLYAWRSIRWIVIYRSGEDAGQLRPWSVL